MRQAMLVASDEATAGSVMPKAERVFASSSGASHARFCSGLAHWCSVIMLGTSGAWQLKASGAQARRPISSQQPAYSRFVRRVPGSSAARSGSARFHRPSARALACSSGMNAAPALPSRTTAWVHSRWRGSTSRSMNAPTRPAMSRARGESSKSILASSAADPCGSMAQRVAYIGTCAAQHFNILTLRCLLIKFQP